MRATASHGRCGAAPVRRGQSEYVRFCRPPAEASRFGCLRAARERWTTVASPSPFARPRGRDYVLPSDPMLDLHLVPEQPQMLHGHLNILSRILEADFEHAIRMPITPGRVLDDDFKPRDFHQRRLLQLSSGYVSP